MLNLRNYGSSSGSESEPDKFEDFTSHLRPIEKGLSVVKSMPLVSIAPVVVPIVSTYIHNIEIRHFH